MKYCIESFLLRGCILQPKVETVKLRQISWVLFIHTYEKIAA
jgi:hypothetical protein